MLATETAKLPGHCCECRAYARSGDYDTHGHPIMWCDTHSTPVRSKAPRCPSYERSPYGRYGAHVAGSAPRPKVPELRLPPTLTAMPDHCDHCGSTVLYRDPDGWGCPRCGWHLWSSASERLYGERPIGDALPSLSGVLAESY